MEESIAKVAGVLKGSGPFMVDNGIYGGTTTRGLDGKPIGAGREGPHRLTWLQGVSLARQVVTSLVGNSFKVLT